MKRIAQMEIQFWRHYTSPLKNQFTLYVRITYGGSRAEIGSTGLRLTTEQWDADARRVEDTHPQHPTLNAALDELCRRLLTAHDVAVHTHRQPLAADIRQAYYRLFEPERLKARTPEPDGVLLTVAFNAWITHRQHLKDTRQLAPGTLKKNKEARTKLREYLAEKKRLNGLLGAWDVKQMNRYRAWLEAKGYGYPHVNKLLKTLRQAILWAFNDQELCETYLLEGFKLKREVLKTPVFLWTAQVDNLRTVPFENPTLQRVADLFVIYCRTGFHYVDLRQVIEDARQGAAQRGDAQAKLRTGIDGNDWIYHARQKTKAMAKVPVPEEIRPIIDKYGGWANLPLMTNQKLNEYLKVIAAMRGLPEKLSVKIGRNTLADWLLNERAWSREAVKVVMGIKTDAILARYVRPDERRVVHELRREQQNQRINH